MIRNEWCITKTRTSNRPLSLTSGSWTLSPWKHFGAFQPTFPAQRTSEYLPQENTNKWCQQFPNEGQTFSQILSNSSIPSVTFFRVLSISICSFLLAPMIQTCPLWGPRPVSLMPPWEPRSCLGPSPTGSSCFQRSSATVLCFIQRLETVLSAPALCKTFGFFSVKMTKTLTPNI